MEYRFFSEYVTRPVPGIPFTAQEDELVWRLDSESDGCGLAERVLREEIGKRGVRLISLLLKRGEGTPVHWETVRTFPAHHGNTYGGAVVLG